MFYLYPAHLGHHGGDYKGYEDNCRLFFTNLMKCNVSPYVVFDGAYDLDDKKLSTLRDRCQDRIKLARDIANGGSGYFLPVLAEYVLRNVLRDLSVPFAVCDFEADNEIVALANDWVCPVLARDSDFFIMDIKEGYLLLDMLDWNHIRNKNATSANSDGKPQTYNYLGSRKYTLTKFCGHFSVKKELISLLATVAGNDYFDTVFINRFLDLVYERPKKGKNPGKKIGSRLFSIVDWLADQDNSEECLEKILGYVKTGKKSKVRAMLETSLKMYLPSDDSKLTEYFTDRSVSSFEGFSGANLTIPLWCLTSFRQGDIPNSIINVMCTQRVFNTVQLENHRMPSANDTAQELRKVLYGILFAQSSESAAVAARTEDSTVRKKEEKMINMKVIEYDRRGSRMTCNEIEPQLHVQNFGRVTNLQDIPKSDEATRRRLLLAALQVDTSGCNSIPTCFHLPAFIIIYWLSHADPKANPNHLRALLLCWVCCFAKQKHVCRPSDPSDGGQPTSHKLGEWGDEEVQTVLNNIRVNVERKMKSYALDIKTAHAYAQMQSCLKAAFHLNAVLLQPYPMPDATLLYSGMLVHCLYGIMKGIPEVDGHQGWLESNLFHKAPTALALYNALHQFITSHIAAEALYVRLPKGTHKRRGGGGGGGGRRGGPNPQRRDGIPSVPVRNKFAGLVLEGDIDDDDDED